MSRPVLPEAHLVSPCTPAPTDDSTHEWLVTNGLGGYASSTVCMRHTRRYHGWLICSLPGLGRTVLLSHVHEELRIGDRFEALSRQEETPASEAAAGVPLKAFRLVGLVPEWELDVSAGTLLRRLVLVHGESTLLVQYENRCDRPLTLRLWPFPTFRAHDQAPQDDALDPRVAVHGGRVELLAKEGARPLRLQLSGTSTHVFTCLRQKTQPLHLRVEKSRGYDDTLTLVTPGCFECVLDAGQTASLVVTSDPWDWVDQLDPHRVLELEHERERHILEQMPESLRTGTAARLALAADQFLIKPSVRPADEAWARATGQHARSVIAGYHWFTDWGRDTMISLEGLTLATHRHAEAGAILRTFQHYVKDGLLPNLFPEGDREGKYNTADATLWFFHAIDRYLLATGDRPLLQDMFPTLEGIVSAHLGGTRFNIHVDAVDGLLAQGAEGVQLTWMDALVDNWVVTPRRGKAVEINALWFNALRLMAEWAVSLGKDPKRYLDWSERAQVSFNKRFWHAPAKYLFDVVDGEKGDDAELRPNQIFAISLKYPVLKRDRWPDVVASVQDALLTPVGLRTLSPASPNYKPAYDGDLRSRDAAYHQGTVWPWLLGHFVDAWLKVHEDLGGARAMLTGLESHLMDACIGQLNEIFDAEPPHRPRGCAAQAWSVAEALRAWIRTQPAG